MLDTQIAQVLMALVERRAGLFVELETVEARHSRLHREIQDVDRAIGSLECLSPLSDLPAAASAAVVVNVTPVATDRADALRVMAPLPAAIGADPVDAGVRRPSSRAAQRRDRLAQVRACLTVTPRRKGEIAAAAGIGMEALKDVLAELVRRGQALATGHTTARRYARPARPEEVMGVAEAARAAQRPPTGVARGPQTLSAPAPPTSRHDGALQLETVWRPGRDAPSLTGSEGFGGSSLCAESPVQRTSTRRGMH